MKQVESQPLFQEETFSNAMIKNFKPFHLPKHIYLYRQPALGMCICIVQRNKLTIATNISQTAVVQSLPLIKVKHMLEKGKHKTKD